MQLGFHFGFKKSKAYGLCGVMLAILFLGMSGHSTKADEMLPPTDTSSTLKESRENHEASYSEVGVHDDSTSQMNLQSEKVLEEKQASLADSSKIAVLTNSSVITSSYQEADDLSEIDQNQSHFLSAIKQGAIDGAKQGVLPSITAAQAILESGWGSSELAMAPNNNLFGIKDSEDWNGEIVTVPTQEYVNGDYITVNAAFRKYTSWNDSVVDHAKFFTSTEWRKNNYRKVVNETDYRIAAQELKNAGYATDPSYAGKLISLIEAYKLYEWDTVSNTTNSVLENEGVESQNPTADLTITGLNNTTGSYDLVISNLVAPRGFKEVLVPTWSEKNGQDDIIWYKAAKQANGDYKVTVRSSNHKGDSNLYNSHVYLVDNDGKYIGLGGKQVTLDITKTQGTLTITNNDKNRGTFDVLITNLTNPSGISGVLIPVWSEQNGQDDLVWHNATKQDDGSYKVTISASQHKWNSGKYIVHGYIVDASGKNIGFGATSADVVAPKKIGSASKGNYDVLNKVVYLDAGHGGYDPGASYFGISEKSLTLAIQSRVKAKLEAQTFAVLRETTAPAVLLELGFLSNPQEAARLNTSAYQETLANAIVAGIKSYYEKESKV
ncbi:MAG: GBS Bsp-like repeat-containing protein [Streptococcus salivarius]|nr:GBS Bsp-like repeat-containing protein [Streptococcus salivarius]